MKKIKSIILLTITFLTSIISGCSSNKQLHERLIIQGVGVDKINDEYILTLNIFDTESAGGENNQQQESSESPGLVTSKGKSIMDAFTNITNITGKEPMYSQNLILIISEETAKSGINSFIDFFVRHYEARPSIDVFVAEGRAKDALNCKLNGKPINSKTISTLAKSSHLNMNVKGSNLVEFVSNIQSKTSDAITALLKIDENSELSAKGSAIFHSDKLISFIDDEETKGYLLTLSEHKGGTEVIFIDNIGLVTYTITSSKNSTNVEIVNNLPVFNLKTEVETNVYEIDRDLKTPLPENCFSVLEAELNLRLKTLIENSIQKCVVENHCDVFEFSRRLMKSHPEYFKSVVDDLDNVIASSKYNVSTEVKINKTGQETMN